MRKKATARKPAAKAAKPTAPKRAKAISKGNRPAKSATRRSGSSKYDQPGAPWWKKLI